MWRIHCASCHGDDMLPLLNVPNISSSYHGDDMLTLVDVPDIPSSYHGDDMLTIVDLEDTLDLDLADTIMIVNTSPWKL